MELFIFFVLLITISFTIATEGNPVLTNSTIDGLADFDDIPDTLRNLPAECFTDRLAEKGVSCSKLLEHQVPASNALYDGYGLHLVPIGHKYFYARMALALGSECPAKSTEPEKMDLYTAWNGLYGGQAHDIGYMGKKVFIRDCTFPTKTTPFLCTGREGNPNTLGTYLGTVAFISVLTDPSPNPDWQMFAQCWNWKFYKSPASWNVFSKNGKLSKKHEALIRAKATQLGFKPSDTVMVNDFDQTID